MPLFNRRAESPEPVVEEQPTRKGSIFSSRRRSDPESVNDNRAADNNSVRSGGGSSFFGRGKDPSITAAREKVRVAEEREKAADQALVHARNAVTEAREHARRLELEAEEDARLAKLKQKEAHGITKSTKGLGRHGP